MNKHWFPKYPFTKSTTLVAFVMVLSASFTRQLMEFASKSIGKAGFRIFIGSILIGTAAVFFISEAKRLVNPLRILLMFVLLVFVSFFVWKIKLPQIRMHILMYALVGWLASRDALRSGKTWKTILVAWLFAAFAGTLEELFQKLLPYRVYEIADVIYNIEGAMVGVMLYLIRPANLTQGSAPSK